VEKANKSNICNIRESLGGNQYIVCGVAVAAFESLDQQIDGCAEVTMPGFEFPGQVYVWL
jgi:hypothetical protein